MPEAVAGVVEIAEKVANVVEEVDYLAIFLFTIFIKDKEIRIRKPLR